MKLTTLSEVDQETRTRLAESIKRVQASGTCPTCKNMVSGELFPPADDRTFYEDASISCFLEQYARNPGHTIILVKRHLEDISELPGNDPVYRVISAAVNSLKTALGAEKVYMCTMCDGPRNHLHFQLIPRFPGDSIRGSRVFVKERMKLADYALDVKRLRTAMSERIR